MNFLYITNELSTAKAIDGIVDYIFIDLEKNGKEERQKNMDTVKSDHSILDISPIKKSIEKSELLVRINPMFKGSYDEINSVIEAGADIIMLPFFKTVEEVAEFLNIVNNRVKTMLLVETREAVDCLDDILNLKEIGYVHIGLNDLSLSYKKKFMFELLCDGTVKKITQKISKSKIPYGFGGIAALDTGTLESNLIIEMHKILGSKQVILSRAFFNEVMSRHGQSNIQTGFKVEVDKIKEYYKNLRERDYDVVANEIFASIERILNAK
ncbi:HpcH/HpaI aldolase/citrate lyase domain-containing protein [Streptococcus pluranimalium]|uniref:aldolase/citrate lyase family protein n=1 Tax=Streptococcus pluranimalium TaxID=82348 RepID=UPI0039E9180E